MTDKDKDRIKCAIRHIKSSLDVDTWAMGIAVDAMQRMMNADGDLISRQAAIDAADKIIERDKSGSNAVVNAMIAWSEYIMTLPSAQPKIVRCKDCKYQDENWRRVSVKWLPCMDIRTGSNWYCGSAERRTDG